MRVCVVGASAKLRRYLIRHALDRGYEVVGVCCEQSVPKLDEFRWSRHVGDPILASDVTRRIDFALFTVAALEDDELIQEAPAIVGRKAPSALAYSQAHRDIQAA